MLTIEFHSSFKKDFKRMKKRGMDMSVLENVLQILASEQELPSICRDHALIGNYQGFRECHIHPDWLLIYRVEHERLTLVAVRTGTHSDLFSK